MAIKFDSTIDLDIDKFFSWWGEQLLTFLPGSIAEFLIQKPDYLVYQREQDGYKISLINQDRARSIGVFPADEAGKISREKLFEKEERIADAGVVLRIAAQQSLRKQIKLPAAAAENMTEVVGYEMNRLTPFNADQVYYSATLTKKLPETKQIVVDLAIVQRQTVDDLLEEMKVWGIVPQIVDVDSLGTSDTVPQKTRNLLPTHLRVAGNNTKKIINMVLGVILAALVLLTVLVPIWLDRQYVQVLQEELRQISDTTRDVEKLRSDVGKLVQETSFLLEQKKTKPVFVALINELTERIPNDTWLTNLRYNNDRLQIHGLSPAASGLIEIIEASSFFDDTSFVSPVTQDRRTRLERFQIAADVVAQETGVTDK